MRHLFSTPAVTVTRVPFPEAGEGSECLMRPLSARAFLALRQMKGDHPTLGGLESAYAILADCLCDEHGNALFVGVADLAEVFAHTPATLDRLATEALRISGVGTEKN